MSVPSHVVLLLAGESGRPRDGCFLAWGSRASGRQARTSSRRSSDDRAATGPERAGPDIFQSGPIIRCGARAPQCVLLNTANDRMFAGLSGGTASFRSWFARRIDSALAGGACATGGQATRQQRLELPTIVWSVVPSEPIGTRRRGSRRRATAGRPSISSTQTHSRRGCGPHARTQTAFSGGHAHPMTDSISVSIRAAASETRSRTWRSSTASSTLRTTFSHSA
jgi:hypothetical protein